jgi:hypothetical protein
MKYFHIIIFYSFIFIYSCKEPLVSFSEAQPEGGKALESFPEKYIGSYYNPLEKIEITISQCCIMTKTVIDDTLNIREFGKDEMIKNDTLLNLITNQKYRITRINDSLFTNYIYEDTTFILGRKYCLKTFKGYLFLNKKKDNGYWEVEKIKLNNGAIEIGSINTQNEINLLESITESEIDTTIVPYKIKLTKKQFKQFIQKNGFAESKVYLKLSK